MILKFHGFQDFRKSNLFEWIIMSFKLKNVTNNFFQTMSKKLKNWTDQIIKVFVDDININHNYCNDHLDHLKILFEKLKNVKF